MTDKWTKRGPDGPTEKTHEHAPLSLFDLLRIAANGIAILVLWSGVLAQYTWVLSLTTLLVCGYPLLKHIPLAIRQRRMTMEVSMVIALTAALVIGEALTSLVIVFFVLIAEELEKMTIQRGRRTIRSMLNLLPEKALVRRAGLLVDLPASEVKVGDQLVARPGTRLLVDGVVLSGHTYIDESAITGEPVPVEKTAGSRVFAGTINQTGVIEIRAERVGLNTAFGQIVETVEHADKARAPLIRTADKLAGYLVYIALGAAMCKLALGGDLRGAISVIVVAGACGVAAGTPLAVLGSIGRAARNGAVVKGGLFLEKLGQADTIVFDKTGTLTRGAARVVSVQAEPGETEDTVVALAASAEVLSEHPLAKAIIKYARTGGIRVSPIDQFHYTPGRGVGCRLNGGDVVVGNRCLMAEQGIDIGNQPDSGGRTEVFVGRNKRLVGKIELADTVREDARAAVMELRKLGLKTLLLTGDNEASAKAVAEELGIEDYAAQLRPEEKQARVKALQEQKKVVAMVGDGINDAPALAQADVGIAVGTGADVAIESADIVLIGNDLLRLVDAVRIARQCRRVILANFVGTILVDVIGMALAIVGIIGPLPAAIIHVGSELAFLLNSARLFPVFHPESNEKEKKDATR